MDFVLVLSIYFETVFLILYAAQRMIQFLQLSDFHITLELNHITILLVGYQIELLSQSFVVSIVFSFYSEKGSYVGHFVKCSDVLKLQRLVEAAFCEVFHHGFIVFDPSFWDYHDVTLVGLLH